MSKNYTIAEVAEKIRVSERTILREIKRGKLKTNKAGRRYLITETQLNEYVGNGEPEVSLAIDTYLHSKKSEMVSFLQHIISRSESGSSEVLSYLKSKLTQFGFRVKVDEKLQSLRVSYGYKDEGILFRAPLDVRSTDASKWTHRPFEGVITKGKLFGRGAYDGKSGMVAALYALRALKKYVPEDSVRVEMIFDTGYLSNLEQLESTVRNQTHAMEGICCVGSGGGVGIGCYGLWNTKVSVLSGEQTGGNSKLNAIHELSSVISALSVPDDSDSVFTHSQRVEVMQIQGGSIDNNPDYCEATFEISTKPGRSKKDASNLLHQSLTINDSLGISFDEIIGYSGYVVDENLIVLKNVSASIESKVGVHPSHDIRLKGFGGEVYYKHEIPLIYFGPRGGNSCTCDEFVEIDSLPQTSAVYADVVLRHFEVR